MAETAVAKIFMHGRSQAVRLPKEFRLPGKEVRIRRVGMASSLSRSKPTSTRGSPASASWPILTSRIRSRSHAA